VLPILFELHPFFSRIVDPKTFFPPDSVLFFPLKCSWLPSVEIRSLTASLSFFVSPSPPPYCLDFFLLFLFFPPKTPFLLRFLSWREAESLNKKLKSDSPPLVLLSPFFSTTASRKLELSQSCVDRLFGSSLSYCFSPQYLFFLFFLSLFYRSAGPIFVCPRLPAWTWQA